MIYKELTFSDFYDEFTRAGKVDSWSYESLRALYDYLDDTRDDIELDVIAFDCDYQLISFDEVKENYLRDEYSEEELEDMTWDECVGWLEDNTTVIPCGYEQAVIAQF